MIGGLFVLAESGDVGVHDSIKTQVGQGHSREKLLVAPQNSKRPQKKNKRIRKKRKRKGRKLKQNTTQQTGTAGAKQKNQPQKPVEQVKSKLIDNKSSNKQINVDKEPKQDAKPEASQANSKKLPKKTEGYPKQQKKKTKKKPNPQQKPINDQNQKQEEKISRYPQMLGSNFDTKHLNMDGIVPSIMSEYLQLEKYLDICPRQLFQKIYAVLAAEDEGIPGNIQNPLYTSEYERINNYCNAIGHQKLPMGGPLRYFKLEFCLFNYSGNVSPKTLIKQKTIKDSRTLCTWKLSKDSVRKIDEYFMPLISDALKRHGFEPNKETTYFNECFRSALFFSISGNNEKLRNMLNGFFELDEQPGSMVLKINEVQGILCKRSKSMNLSKGYLWNLLVLLHNLFKSLLQNKNIFEIIDKAMNHDVLQTKSNKASFFLMVLRVFMFDCLVKYLVRINHQ
jgi:hypothetical protein